MSREMAPKKDTPHIIHVVVGDQIHAGIVAVQREESARLQTPVPFSTAVRAVLIDGLRARRGKR